MCSLVIDYLAPLFPNTFHSSPLTLAPLHPLQVLLIDMLHLAFSGGELRTPPSLVVCLLDRVWSVPQLYLLNTSRGEFHFSPKVRYHQSCLLTHVRGRSYLALWFGIRVCSMLHLEEGNSWMVVHTLLQASCALILPSLIHKLTCLINYLSLV